MSISFHCPACGHRLKVADASAGKRGRCPACHVSVQVPWASTDSAVIPIARPASAATATAPTPIPIVSDDDQVVAPAPAPWRPGNAASVPSPAATATATAPAAPTSAPMRMRSFRFWSPSQAYSDAPPIRVVVVDFNMPFLSMLGFMIKLAIAAIPAAFIVAVIYIFLMGFGGVAAIQFLKMLAGGK